MSKIDMVFRKKEDEDR